MRHLSVEHEATICRTRCALLVLSDITVVGSKSGSPLSSQTLPHGRERPVGSRLNRAIEHETAALGFYYRFVSLYHVSEHYVTSSRICRHCHKHFVYRLRLCDYSWIFDFVKLWYFLATVKIKFMKSKKDKRTRSNKYVIFIFNNYIQFLTLQYLCLQYHFVFLFLRGMH